MNSSTIHPVQVLREHVAALEAAVVQCEASLEPRSVHKLRTSSRRLEAVVLLLGKVPSLPEHRKRAEKLGHAVARVRRAAGHVRDLDVHGDMLALYADTEGALAAQETKAADLQAKSKGTRSALKKQGAAPAEAQVLEEASRNAAELQASATELRAKLNGERESEAAALAKVLRTAHGKVARAAEALLERLGPAEALEVTANDLKTDAEVLFRGGTHALRDGEIVSLSSKQLHNLRKAAKAGRYLAETLPGDAAVAETAARLQGLQQLGGQWHDALEITGAARRHFGRKHPLTMAYRALRQQHLEAYRAALEQEARPKSSPAPKKAASARSRAPRNTAAAA